MPLPARLALALAAALAAAPGFAGGPVLLTVTGAISNPNRGPLDPAWDKLFVLNEASFDRAHEFDVDALAALPQVTVRADFPRGGPVSAFTGPKLADVLAAAGAEGEAVIIQAMDGYTVEQPIAELVGRAAILATARDGEALGIGGFGPMQLVFPRAERSDLGEMNDDWWIWQVYHIAVE
jgi:hypothetical protein